MIQYGKPPGLQKHKVTNLTCKLTTNTTIRVTLFLPFLCRGNEFSWVIIFTNARQVAFQGFWRERWRNQKSLSLAIKPIWRWIYVSYVVYQAESFPRFSFPFNNPHSCNSHYVLSRHVMTFSVFLRSPFNCIAFLNSSANAYIGKYIICLRTWILSNPFRLQCDSKASTTFRRIKMISMRAVLRKTTAGILSEMWDL